MARLLLTVMFVTTSLSFAVPVSFLQTRIGENDVLSTAAKGNYIAQRTDTLLDPSVEEAARLKHARAPPSPHANETRILETKVKKMQTEKTKQQAKETETFKTKMATIRGQSHGGVQERFGEAAAGLMSRASQMFSNLFFGTASQDDATANTGVAKNELKEDRAQDLDSFNNISLKLCMSQCFGNRNRNAVLNHQKCKLWYCVGCSACEHPHDTSSKHNWTSRLGALSMPKNKTRNPHLSGQTAQSDEKKQTHTNLATATMPNRSQNLQEDATLNSSMTGQLGGIDDEELDAGLTALLNESSRVMDTINSQINEFKRDYPHKINAKVADEILQYKMSLVHKHDNTTLMRIIKKKWKGKLYSLRKNIIELQVRAHHFEENITVLKQQVEVMRSNLTLAEEFLVKAEQDSNYANDMAVLRELHETDSRGRNELLHSLALEALDNSVALLQTDGDVPDIRNYMQVIEAKFGDLHHELDADFATLKQQYENEFAKEAEIQHTLQIEIDDLRRKHQAQQELKKKLEAAVSHLERVTGFLQQRIRNLHKYATLLSFSEH